MPSWPDLKWAVVGGLIVGIAVLALPVAAGVGDPILAGVTNEVGEQTRIKGAVGAPNLKVTNTNADGIAASFLVEPGNPPFKVSSNERVKNLNADKVDGKSVGALLTKAAYDTDKDGVVDDAEAVGGLTAHDIQALATLPPPSRLDFGSIAHDSTVSAIPPGTVLTSITLTAGISNSNGACQIAVEYGSVRLFRAYVNNGEYLGHVFAPGIVSDGTLKLVNISPPGCNQMWAVWTGYTDTP